MFATPGIHNHQESSEGIGTQCGKSFFSRKVVSRRQRKCIAEHRNRISKADTMLLQIGCRFVWIPLIVHRQPPLLGPDTFTRLYVQMYTESSESCFSN